MSSLVIGDLVGLIQADDSGMRRGLSDAELAMRGFQRDTEGRLRHLNGQFATSGDLIAAGLATGTNEGDRFTLSLGRIAGMAGSLGGVAMSVGRIAAMLGAAAPAAAGLVATLANIAPAGAVGVTAMLALKQATFVVKLATQGMDDALSAALDPSKAEEFNEALKQLSPEAKAFALAVRDIAPAWKEVQQSVQDEFFRGLSENFERTAKSVLPVLRRELFNTATALGDMAAGAMGAARELAENGTLGKAMGSASKGLSNLSGLPGIVVTALGQIAAAAGPSFEGLTAAAAHSANQIGQKLGAAFESGRMQDAIQDAIDLIGDLVDVAMNVGSIIGSIFDAASVSGGGLIGTLEEVTGALAEAFASPEVQDGLKALFGTMALIAETAAPLLGQALGLIAPILTELGPPIQALVVALGEALQPILAALGPVLIEAAAAFGELIIAALPLIELASELIVALLPSLVPLIQLLAEVIRAVAPGVQMVAEGLQLLLLPVLSDMAEFIGEVVVPALMILVDLLQGDFSSAQEAAADLTQRMIDSQVRAWSAFPGRVRGFALDFMNQTIDSGQRAASGMLRAVRGMLGDVGEQLGRLPGIARAQLSGIAGALIGAGQDLISGFIDGIQSMIPSVEGVLSGLTSNLPDWKGPADLDAKILTPAGRLLIEGFQRGIDLQTPSLRKQLQGLTTDLRGMPMAAVPAGMGAQPSGSVYSPTTTYNLTQREMTLQDLEALQRRQEALARLGRPR
ncbi:phage tail protein [Streptomyces albicerus]|uniref:phage tail protein n=1 Tax=Streptomyces albicerus TaxID=2569859 RepID=UPI001CED2746|nr:hypothetical protein [Streptomyces albicerus]